jgi:DNA-binding MarR family transcriptional regulator
MGQRKGSLNSQVSYLWGAACHQVLHRASYCDAVTKVEPLSAPEEDLWRAIMRIVKVLPRHLDSDLIRGTGLSASEYTTIMHLSEAPNRELRMSDLASATGFSASRMTRLVDDLQSRSLVTKVASSTDARGNVARVTPRGMAKLRAAWPVHLESVRTRFLDHLNATSVKVLAHELSLVANQLEDSPSGGTHQK